MLRIIIDIEYNMILQWHDYEFKDLWMIFISKEHGQFKAMTILGIHAVCKSRIEYLKKRGGGALP